MKIRQSNYELMRIVSMFLIVIFHILWHGRVLEHTSSTLHLFFVLVMCFCMAHVNSFMLLSGYFNCEKEFAWKKFFKVFNQAWFYQVVIVCLVAYFGITHFGSKMEIIDAVSPLNFSYWFIVYYLLLYVLSPFFNRVIAHLNQKEHKRLLIVCFILFMILPFITRQELIANNGYTFIQFVCMYFFGAYLKKYPLKKNFHFKNYSKNKLQILLFSGMIVFWLLHFFSYMLSGVFITYDNTLLQQFGMTLKDYFLYYSAPFVVLQSLCYFLWFGTLNFKCKFINLIATLVFGVYLIHDNDYLRDHLYKWLGLDVSQHMIGWDVILQVFICAIIIFVICSLIEFVRQQLFKFIGNLKIIEKIKLKFVRYIKDIN